MAKVEQAAKAAAAATGVTSVEFEGRVWRVKPPQQWRNSAMDGIAEGRFNVWARAALVDEDAAAFVAADLTFAQSTAFVEAYTAAAGQAPGE